jgi:predicted esterase
MRMAWQPVETATVPPDSLQIPWVAHSAVPPLDTWLQLPLRGKDGTERARAQVLLTDEHFMLELTASDAHHVLSVGGGSLWQGDSLQLALDLHGDGAGREPVDARGPFGVDDIALGLAWTARGSEGWIYYQDRALGRGGPLPAQWVTVDRDEPGQTTRYRLRLPWQHLGVTPGLSQTMGLAIMLNDYSPEHETPDRAYFGDGADGIPRPGLHARLRLPAPPTAIAVAKVENRLHWADNEPAALVVAVAGRESVVIEAAATGADPIRVQPEPDGTIHRYRLFTHGALSEDAVLTLRVVAAAAAQVGTVADPAANPPVSPRLKQEMAVIHPQSRLLAFEQRIAALLNQPEIHPLFAHHLRSLHALVLSEWARLQVYRTGDLRRAASIVDTIAGLTEALAGEVGEWSAYLDGRRSLLMGYISPHDGSYQFYLLNLPRDWEPERAYPLFFELHGAGDDNPLRSAAFRLLVHEATPNLHGYTAPKTYAEIQRKGYWVHPFGRGNLGYRGIAEIDIFEAYDDAHRRFTIDPDRRYLYGFSMGGGGTWANALRTPDRWAAIAILAGAPRGDLSAALIPNLRHMPVWIWCGEDDRLFPRTLAMAAALRAHGIEPVYSTTPGLGHSYIMEQQQAVLNWLQGHVRQRPDHFEFRTDSDRHRSAWGITLAPTAAEDCVAGFAVRIEGTAVHIVSNPAIGLSVDPGPQGLGLSGDITVYWNQHRVYAGPVTTLQLNPQ